MCYLTKLSAVLMCYDNKIKSKKPIDHERLTEVCVVRGWLKILNSNRSAIPSMGKNWDNHM